MRTGPADNGPMDPAKYQELVQIKQAELASASIEAPVFESYTVPTVSTDFARELLEESLERRLSGGELLVLFEEAALTDLGRVAQLLRLKRTDPDHVTYIIDRNVTYTNLCYADCGFCAFNRHQGDGDEYLLSLDEILQKCKTVYDAGGSQILLQGGHHPKERLPFYEEMLKGIKAEWPDMWIHGFSPSEIQHFARLNKISTFEVIKRLKAVGLDSVPGGGAEILNDRVRKILAPGKTMSDEWISIMEECHQLGLPSTVTMMFAHVETYAERVEHFLRVRESQDKTGGYTAFIPWTFQPNNTPLMKNPALKAQVEAIGYLGSTDYLRTLAISRIALDNFANIQSSWVTQGKAIGQLTLYYGANDLGSLMMEESVVSSAGVSHPLTRDDLDEIIIGAGFKPALRDNGYKIQA
ncbi:MAG: cyclic dehypoxanthinyl futalosine synthase [Candidatus Krumholzibacteriia bacterium]|jgi:cyclic dehypoxanthinyl futalosine synthase